MANQAITAEAPQELNAQLNLWSYDDEGKPYINFDADKEAARQYHLQEINANTQFFYSLREKLEFLFDNDYYEPENWTQYGMTVDDDGSIIEDDKFEKVKDLYRLVYDKKHRFKTFMGAQKFYLQYAMKSFDGKKWMERYEDRVVATALMLGRGDMDLARDIAANVVNGNFQPATPTFGNAGKKQRGEMVSCFLSLVDDNMESISKAVATALQLSKRGGGVALNLTNLRETGAPIKNIEGQASGVVPIMKILEDSFSYADQLGQRKGSGAVYLSVHHPDIERFLDTKRENADEKIRIKTLSLGIVITDAMMNAAQNNEDLYLFSPYSIKKEYGKDMSQISISDMYQELIDNPNIKKTKVNPRKLLRQIAEVQFESGYPYFVFEDTVNEANPIEGRVSFSNLCVTGDSMILTDNGYRYAKDLYDSQEDFQVVVDNRAKGRSTDIDYGLSVVSSTKMVKTNENATVYLLETNEGFSIRATAWHIFFVVRDGEFMELELKDVKEGDQILIQSGEGTFGSWHGVDIAYLAGTLAADGTFAESSTGDYHAKWYLYGDKSAYEENITSAAHRVLEGRDDLLNDPKDSLTPTFSEGDDRLSMSSGPLSRALEEAGVAKGLKEAVPAEFFEADRATQIAFIDGVFQLDGTITGSKDAGSCTIELGSVSKEFLQGVQRLLINLGIYSKIYQTRSKSTEMFPDGKGGEKEHDVNAIYSLRVTDSQARIKMYSLVEWNKERHARWEELDGGRETRDEDHTHKFLATVSSVMLDGIEDVYDVKVEDGESVIFNGIATHNCSEILQVSEPATFDDEGHYAYEGRDISCNLGSMNVDNVMASGALESTVDSAIRALTSVSDISDLKIVPSIRRGNELSHAIGLGQMSLASYFLRMGWEYGSQISLDFTNAYFMTVAYHAYRTSNQIAMERGESFYEFEKSKYADPSYLTEKYSNPELIDVPDNVREVFSATGIAIPTQEDWAELAQSIAENGLYNAYLQAVPPTGSISYINHASASIHPFTDPMETRKEGMTGRVYYPQPNITSENFAFAENAYDVGYKKIIDVYAKATPHVDQGLSLTLFFRDKDRETGRPITTKDFNKAQIYAWKKGIKTLYYIRFSKTDLAGTEVEGCVSCAL